MSSFSFGKHKGKTFQEVADSDPGYCQWALKQDEPGGALKKFVEFIKASGHEAASKAPASSSGPLQTSSKPHWMKAANAPVTNFVFHGPRLDDDTTLVMALDDDGHFAVRAEKNAGVSFGGKAAGKSRSGTNNFMAPHIWQAIKDLKDCRVSAAPDGGKSFLFPIRRLEEVRECLEKIGKVEPIPAWVLKICRASDSQKGDCLMQERLPDKLFPYQIEGVRYGLEHCGRCLIGDEMGLGKTVQALALAAQYADEWPVLVVCPSSLRWVWKEQICDWLSDLVEEDDIQVIKKGSDALDPDARFWIVSYAMFASNAKTESKSLQQRPDGSNHGIVIVDESHNIKEWSAARTKALVPVLKKAKRLFLLSGTPTRNKPDELHSQLSCLIPAMFVKMAEFRARYCTQQQDMFSSGNIVSRVTGARNSSELNYVLAKTVMVRRLKKDVLQELPPKRRQKVPLESADARQLKEIHNKNNLFDQIDNEDKAAVFKKMAEVKLPAVKEHILEMLDRGDEKAIIFAHHRLMIDGISGVLEKRLAQDGLHHIRIDGSTPAAKRPDLVKEFQTNPNCRIALLSITACGEGITLTAAGLVIFAELPFVPGAVEQAEARAHRIGTTHNKVVVEFLVLPGSFDERTFSNLERKKKDTSKCLDGAEESLGVLDRLSRKRAREIEEDRGGIPTLVFPDKKRQNASFGTSAEEKSVSQMLNKEANASSIGVAAEDDKSPAPKKKSDEANATVGKSPQLTTPPPVMRSKVEALLRAAKG